MAVEQGLTQSCMTAWGLTNVPNNRLEFCEGPGNSSLKSLPCIQMKTNPEQAKKDQNVVVIQNVKVKARTLVE